MADTDAMPPTQRAPVLSAPCEAAVAMKLHEMVGSRTVSSLEASPVARRITMVLTGIMRQLGYTGTVEMFGSYSNGFKTGTSDLDVVFLSDPSCPIKTPNLVLKDVADILEDKSFANVTRILAANVPIVKLTDHCSGLEIDFCVNNILGVRNSKLLLAYCKYDRRVLMLGCLVKDWAKKNNIVGTTDGCLNSYAYMLLVIYYLMGTTPALVPNLQSMATDSFFVRDTKWDQECQWDTKFHEDVGKLPPSSNKDSLATLAAGFFRFYSEEFDWQTNAVAMRFGGDQAIGKFCLLSHCQDDHWYIEDPFDLKHNLAGKCSLSGRARILDAMRTTFTNMKMGKWVVPHQPSDSFLMKTRVIPDIKPQEMLECFVETGLTKLHMPRADAHGRFMVAFLEFPTAKSRRIAHTKNENWVGQCQMQLHYTTVSGFQETLRLTGGGVYTTFEMSSYKMQRRVALMREGVMLPGEDEEAVQQWPMNPAMMWMNPQVNVPPVPNPSFARPQMPVPAGPGPGSAGGTLASPPMLPGHGNAMMGMANMSWQPAVPWTQPPENRVPPGAVPPTAAAGAGGGSRPTPLTQPGFAPWSVAPAKKDAMISLASGLAGQVAPPKKASTAALPAPTPSMVATNQRNGTVRILQKATPAKPEQVEAREEMPARLAVEKPDPSNEEGGLVLRVKSDLPANRSSLNEAQTAALMALLPDLLQRIHKAPDTEVLDVTTTMTYHNESSKMELLNSQQVAMLSKYNGARAFQ